MPSEELRVAIVAALTGLVLAAGTSAAAAPSPPVPAAAALVQPAAPHGAASGSPATLATGLAGAHRAA